MQPAHGRHARAATRGSAAARMLPRLVVKKSRNLVVLALGLSVGLSIGFARSVPADKPEPLGQNLPWQDARLLAEVLERVEREYVDPRR